MPGLQRLTQGGNHSTVPPRQPGREREPQSTAEGGRRVGAGSELLVSGAQTLLARFHISDLPVGMTILAFLVSIEEIERELPAMRRGRPDSSFGNVLGAIPALFLCNAGIIALVRPVPGDRDVLMFYLPLAFITSAVVSGFMLTKRLPHWAGGVLITLYLIIVIGGWVIWPR